MIIEGSMKKGVVLLFLSCFIFFSISLIVAQETETRETLDGGINSGFLHDIDVALDRLLQSDLENSHERAAEIIALIKEGKLAEAKQLLELYKEFADMAEKEISPDEEAAAEASSEQIQEALEEATSEISEEDKQDFAIIKDQEERIKKAGAIASKIKELCNELALVDPEQYDQICSVDDDTPSWRKKQHTELTQEQEKEVRAFGKIMSQCFKDPATCRCNEISIKAFADRCEIVAPLAVKCEQEGDKSACDAMEEATRGIEELLPEHLQEVMSEIEEEFSSDQFNLHMPEECVTAGATTPEDCRRVMIQAHAPEECKSELTKQNIKNEKEAREICEKIMFKENAPSECIEAGITNHRECGSFMFKQSAPEECIAAGLTGEKSSDSKKCREIMDNLGGKEMEGDGNFNENRGRFNGGDCRRIENAEERLRCYDGALEDASEFRNEDSNEPHRKNFPQPCQDAGALTPETCGEFMRQWGETQRQAGEERMGERPEGLSEEERRQFEDEYRRQFEGKEGEMPPLPQDNFDNSKEQQPSSSETVEQKESSSSSDSGSSSEGSSSSSEESSGSSSASGSVTAGVIFDIEDNAFLGYYFR